MCDERVHHLPSLLAIFAGHGVNSTQMAQRLVCLSPGVIGWQEVAEREPEPGEVRVRPKFGVEKHGTMAAFVKGYANERGSWDAVDRVHRSSGVLWNYPVPLGNMQFGVTESGRVAWWGPFQDLAIVAATNLIEIEEVHWVDAAMQDPGEFALGALRDGGMRLGDTVAVFGLGAIGLACVQLARAAGAACVFALDPIEARRTVAERYGAVSIDPTIGDAGMALREATAMLGVDVVIEYFGAWRALQAAFRGVAYGGTIAYGAFPAPFPAGLDLGGEAHMNRPRLISTRACSDPNPDHPRWSEGRIRATVWDFIRRGSLKGVGIVDLPVPFGDLAEIYPEIAAHPERHLKLSVEYPAD
jgi:threonine dehydrogenase-like Zn-dependent dehydrogenase